MEATNGPQYDSSLGPEQTQKARTSRALYLDTGYVDALAFGPDGLLYGGYSWSSIRFKFGTRAKPKRQERVGTIYDTGYVDALAFGPDGLLYGGYSWSSIRFKFGTRAKPKRQERVGTIYDTGYVDALAFGPDGLLYGGY